MEEYHKSIYLPTKILNEVPYGDFKIYPTRHALDAARFDKNFPFKIPRRLFWRQEDILSVEIRNKKLYRFLIKKETLASKFDLFFVFELHNKKDCVLVTFFAEPKNYNQIINPARYVSPANSVSGGLDTRFRSILSKLPLKDAMFLSQNFTAFVEVN